MKRQEMYCLNYTVLSRSEGLTCLEVKKYCLVGHDSSVC